MKRYRSIYEYTKPHESGEHWKTPSGTWGALSPDKEYHYFSDEDIAKMWASHGVDDPKDLEKAKKDIGKEHKYTIDRLDSGEHTKVQDPETGKTKYAAKVKGEVKYFDTEDEAEKHAATHIGPKKKSRYDRDTLDIKDDLEKEDQEKIKKAKDLEIVKVYHTDMDKKVFVVKTKKDKRNEVNKFDSEKEANEFIKSGGKKDDDEDENKKKKGKGDDWEKDRIKKAKQQNKNKLNNLTNGETIGVEDPKTGKEKYVGMANGEQKLFKTRQQAKDYADTNKEKKENIMRYESVYEKIY